MRPATALIRRARALSLVAFALSLSTALQAAPSAPSGSASALPGGSASAWPSGSLPAPSGSLLLPPDFPKPGAEPGAPAGNALPPGHPPTGAQGAPQGGQPGQPGMPQLPRVPQDMSGGSMALPPGTIEATVLDENDKPLADVPVMLSLLRSSVAQGETRTTRSANSDANGVVRFSGLQSTSDWVYQVKVIGQGADPSATATYSTPQFNLIPSGGWVVRIHRFPVTTRMEDLIAAFEIVVASLEFREDGVDVSMEFNLMNLSPKAWSLGQGMDLPLPNGFRGLRAAEGSDNVVVTAMEGKGARWAGAFPPGQWVVQYDFKVPYEGESSVDVDIDLPPRVLNAAVRVAGRKGTQLRVDGFDAPREEIAPNGARFLTALRRGDPNTPIGKMSIHVTGLPEPGPEKWAAIAVGLAGLLAGIFALARVTPESAAPAPLRAIRREQLLGELVTLERARRGGEVGPKAYAEERARLLDGIADTLADPDAKRGGEEAPAPAKKRARA